MKNNALPRVLLLVAILVGLAMPAVAQTPAPIEAGKAFTLTADHDCTNVTAYRVYQDGVQVGSDLPVSSCSSGAVTSPTLPGLTVGTHTFRVGAVNALGEVQSAELTVSALTLPTAPGNLKITLTVTVSQDGTPTITLATAERIK